MAGSLSSAARAAAGPPVALRFAGGLGTRAPGPGRCLVRRIERTWSVSRQAVPTLRDPAASSSTQVNQHVRPAPEYEGPHRGARGGTWRSRPFLDGAPRRPIRSRARPSPRLSAGARPTSRSSPPRSLDLCSGVPKDRHPGPVEAGAHGPGKRGPRASEEGIHLPGRSPRSSSSRSRPCRTLCKTSCRSCSSRSATS